MACFCAEVRALDPWGAAGLDGESTLDAEGVGRASLWGRTAASPGT